MKVANRIAAGYAVILLLVIALAAYHSASMSRARLSPDPSGSGSLRMAQAALEIMRLSDRIGAGMTMPAAEPGEESRKEGQEVKALLEERLQELQESASGEKSVAEVRRLAQSWADVSRMAPPPRPGFPPVAESQAAETSEPLERFRTQAYSVYQLCLHNLEESSRATAGETQRARYLTWLVSVAIVTLGLLAAILVVRSVALPLGALAEGTRALAEGKSYVRLDTTRNDEFGQIAKDINILANPKNNS